MWLDTSTWRGRSDMVTYAMDGRAIDPWDDNTHYSTTETPAQAATAAMNFLAKPALTGETSTALLDFATKCLPSPMDDWQQSPYRAMRQNAVRHVILTSSDWHAN